MPIKQINHLISQLLPLVPRALIWRIARRYIPGEHLSDALLAIKKLNRNGFSATLDYLGEDPKQISECREALEIYKRALEEIQRHQLDCGISVKLSHMGLKLDRSFCQDNMETLLSHAAPKKIFVRIDMEDFSLRPDTLDIHQTLKQRFDNVGTVLQAYLRCAGDDAARLAEHKADIRLCKGAYFWESSKVVFKNFKRVQANYLFLMEKLISNGCFTALATHDEKLISAAIEFAGKNNIPTSKFEFQMLFGVQEQLRDQILRQKFPVRIYVPFGTQWPAYCLRRLKENPDIIRHVISAAINRRLHPH